MKTFEQVQNLAPGESFNFGNGPVGACKVRRTGRGVIATNSNGSFYVRNNDIERSFANLNTIGLQSIDYSVRSWNQA